MTKHILKLITDALIIANSLTEDDYVLAVAIIIVVNYIIDSLPEPQIEADFTLEIEHLSSVSLAVDLDLGHVSLGPLTGSCSVQPSP